MDFLSRTVQESIYYFMDQNQYLVGDGIFRILCHNGTDGLKSPEGSLLILKAEYT